MPVYIYRDPAQPDRFRLIDGERRWLMALRLGLDKIPAIIRESPPDDAKNIVEMFNIHKVREDWEDMPTARALKQVMDRTGTTDVNALRDLTGLWREQIVRYLLALDLPVLDLPGTTAAPSSSRGHAGIRYRAMAPTGRSAWANDVQHFAVLAARCLLTTRKPPPDRARVERAFAAAYRRNFAALRERFGSEASSERIVLRSDAPSSYLSAAESWRHIGTPTSVPAVLAVRGSGRSLSTTPGTDPRERIPTSRERRPRFPLCQQEPKSAPVSGIEKCSIWVRESA